MSLRPDLMALSQGKYSWDTRDTISLLGLGHTHPPRPFLNKSRSLVLFLRLVFVDPLLTHTWNFKLESLTAMGQRCLWLEPPCSG